MVLTAVPAERRSSQKRVATEATYTAPFEERRVRLGVLSQQRRRSSTHRDHVIEHIEVL